MKKIIILVIALCAITHAPANPDMCTTTNINFLNYTNLLMHIKLSWADGVTRTADLPGKGSSTNPDEYTGIILKELLRGTCNISVTREDPGICARWLGSLVSKPRLLKYENQQAEMLSWEIDLADKSLAFLFKSEEDPRLVAVRIIKFSKTMTTELSH